MENQHVEEMTEEQLKERKDEMLQFYKESMPYLEAQLNYEKTLTEIEEQRFKRATYQMQWAMMMQGPGEGEEELPSHEDLKEMAQANMDKVNFQQKGGKKLKRS